MVCLFNPEPVSIYTEKKGHYLDFHPTVKIVNKLKCNCHILYNPESVPDLISYCIKMRMLCALLEKR